MAYSVLTNLKNQINEDDLVMLSDDADAGIVDTTVTTAMIAKADAVIDSYLATKYSVPLSPVPEILTHYSTIIALHLLFARRSGAPEHIQKLYDNAIMFLENVREGNITLGADDPAGDRSDDEATEFATDNPARVFSRAKMAGF